MRLYPYNINQKVSFIVEHFRENVVNLLGDRAKTMIVSGSRKGTWAGSMVRVTDNGVVIGEGDAIGVSTMESIFMLLPCDTPGRSQLVH